MEDNHTVCVETSPCADGNITPPLSYDFIVSTTHRANNFSHTISSRNTTPVTKTIPFANNFTPLNSVKNTPLTQLMQDKDFKRKYPSESRRTPVISETKGRQKWHQKEVSVDNAQINFFKTAEKAMSTPGVLTTEVESANTIFRGGGGGGQ